MTAGDALTHLEAIIEVTCKRYYDTAEDYMTFKNHHL